jgi:hypothetical protein
METRFYENGIIEILDDNIIIREPNDINEMFGLFHLKKCTTIIIKKENIIKDFYKLSTGVAGEILQKVSNYRKRMAIIGDFENMKSETFKDFIYESNKTKQIIFVKTLEEALNIFKE